MLIQRRQKMKAACVVSHDDIDLFTCATSTSNSRGSDEMPDHVYQIEQLLVDEVWFGDRCHFDGTKEELRSKLEAALKTPRVFVCYNAARWEES